MSGTAACNRTSREAIDEVVAPRGGSPHWHRVPGASVLNPAAIGNQEDSAVPDGPERQFTPTPAMPRSPTR